MDIASHLERIRSSIDDPDPYLVFADWLQEEGDPWGELIVLQHTLEERPGDSAIASKIDALCKKHKWTQAFKPEVLRLDWKWGFIRGVKVYDQYAFHSLGKILKPVMSLPMAALVEACEVFRDEEQHKETLPPRSELVPHITANADTKYGNDIRWLTVSSHVPSSVKACTKLAFLECRGAQRLPATLSELPLERIDLDRSWNLQSIPDAIWGIESLGYISMYDCDSLDLNMGQVNNLLAGFLKARSPRKQRIFEAALFQGKAPKASQEQLFLALDNNLKVVRERALDLLEELIESPLSKSPIDQGSVVVVFGKLTIDKKVLGARLKDRGAKLATKITKETTHVLLGKAPKGKHHDLGELPILLESHLGELMSTEDGAPPLPMSVLATQLRSKDDAQIRSAVQVLHERGTIPKELLPELFCVLQNTELSKLGKGRSQAKKLFAAYAPKKLQGAVAKHMKTSVLLAGESKQAERLSALEKNAGDDIDMARVAELFVHDFGAGLKYTMQRGDKEALDKALRLRIAGGNLNLDFLELNSLPDLSSYDLKAISLEGNHFTKFPAEVLALSGVETVVLSGNRLRSLPRDMSAMTRLTRLYLAHNCFAKFPVGVTSIPNLQELDLNSDCWGATRIEEIPAEVTRLTKLKVLKVSNGRVAVKLPAEISSMKSLEQFEVSWEDEIEKPPAALQALLPQCKIH